MEDPDLYDDILGGTLSPTHVSYVEALLEVGVHRRVMRLPEGGSPLQTVREAATRLLNSDAGLRNVVGSSRLVFQRRSLKFDTWVDMEKAGERPVTDGERLRALPVPVLEAGEVMTSDGEGDREDRQRRSSEKRRHKRRRRRSGSSDDERRRRHRHRRRQRSTSRGSSSAGSGDSEERRRRRAGRKERHRHSHRRHRRSRSRTRSQTRSRSRSVSSDSDSGRSRGGRRRLSDSDSSGRGRGSSARRATSSGGSSYRRRQASPTVSSKRRVPPPRQVSAKAWQHMDPEFAEQLREYELERARKEGREELCKHLSQLADISDGELSPSDSHSDSDSHSGSDCNSDSNSPRGSGRDGMKERKEGDKSKDMSDLGLRVLDRLKKLREQLGGGDGACSSADGKAGKDGAETKGEDKTSSQGRVYAAYLNLDGKHPVMALHEYCTARRWEAPFFHLTEKPGTSNKQKLFSAAVRVNKRMYTMPELLLSKKDGKRSAALYCLKKLGVIKEDAAAKEAPDLDEINLPY